MKRIWLINVCSLSLWCSLFLNTNYTMNIRENEILNEAIRQLNDYLGRDGAVSLIGDDSITILGTYFIYPASIAICKSSG